MIVERFATSERAMVLAGFEQLYTIMISEPAKWSNSLRQWKQRQNRSIIVSPANRKFYTRLMYGADLKNQARPMLTEGLSSIAHLNLSQLLMIWKIQTGYIDWIKSETAIIREFAKHVEDEIKKQFIQYLIELETSNIDSTISNMKPDVKMVVGLKILLFLGAAATYYREADVWWYILIASKEDDPSLDEPVGIFCMYPSLKTDCLRPSASFYSLATSCRSRYSNVFEISNYCVTKCEASTSIIEFAKYLHSFKDSKLEKSIGQAGEDDRNTDEEAESSNTECDVIGSDYCVDEEDKTVDELTQEEAEGEGDGYVEGEGEEGVEWEYITDPEEGYTLYWDPYNEMYMYCDYPIQYDVETEMYYIFDEEEQDYYYLDEESTRQINEGEVPTWNYEIEDPGTYEGYYLAADGYYYPLEDQEAGEDDEILDIDIENEAPQILMTEVENKDAAAGHDNEGTTNICASLELRVSSNRSMRQAHRLRTAEQLRASDSVILQKATVALKEDLYNYFGEEGVADLLDSWIKRSNGELRVGRNKRLIQGLISGELELKGLPMVNVSDVSSVLPDMNLPQIVRIRHTAQNCTWETSPVSSIRVFAIKADATISERLLMYCLYKDNKEICLDIVRNGGSIGPTALKGDFRIQELRSMARQLLQLYGASKLWKDVNNLWSGDSWWYLAADSTSLGTIKSIRGLFVHVPSMKVQSEKPNTEQIYHLSRGSQNLGYVIWDILPMNAEK